jgi:adenine deaminase
MRSDRRNKVNLLTLLAVARGDQPADLLLRNAHLVNVFSGQYDATITRVK